MVFNNESDMRKNLDSKVKELNSKDIAIIGISATLPKADSPEEYWENILVKAECLDEFPKERREFTDKYLKFKGIDEENIKYYKGNFLNNIDKFDTKLFHLSPKESNIYL